VKVSSGAEHEDDPTAGDEGSTSKSEPARGELLLDERNDTTLLTLPMNLLILPAKNKHKAKTTHEKIGIRENNTLGVSHPGSQ
jgi:hypothetical protein